MPLQPSGKVQELLGAAYILLNVVHSQERSLPGEECFRTNSWLLTPIHCWRAQKSKCVCVVCYGPQGIQPASDQYIHYTDIACSYLLSFWPFQIHLSTMVSPMKSTHKEGKTYSPHHCSDFQFPTFPYQVEKCAPAYLTLCSRGRCRF